MYIDTLGQGLSRAAKAEAEATKSKANATRLIAEVKKAEETLKANGNPNSQAAVERAKKSAEEAIEKAKVALENAVVDSKSADEAMLAGTLPPGMETWYEVGFSPGRAGWKSGFVPFGNVDGKLAPANNCRLDFCNDGAMPKTLWEKDVLLMRTTLQVPPLKPDHRYRLLLGGNIHSKQGSAVTVYINGKPVHQQGGFGGRLRSKPRGFFIDKALAEEFKGGKVTLAVAALRPPRAHLTVWLEEMKMPPLGEEVISNATLRAPMMSAAWQELQDPDTPPEDPNEGKYHYDGKFADVPMLRGEWTIVNQVATIEEFTGEENPRVPNVPFATISFNSNGKTNDPLWIWSGNMLISLARKEALEMDSNIIGGTEYLFIESGGFKATNPKGWQSSYHVLKKAKP